MATVDQGTSPEAPDLRATEAWGFALALAGAFLFALVYALPKIAGTGLGILQIAFLRFGLGFLTALPVALLARRRGRLPSTGVARWHALRAVFGIASLGCAVYAAQHMLLADAITLANSKALFVVVLAALFLKERVTGRRLLAVLLALTGATVVVQPSAGFLERMAQEPAALIALAAALAIAIELIMLRYLSDKDGALVAILWFNGAAAAILLPVMPFVWEAPDAMEWLLLGAMGPVAVLGNLSNLLAYRRLEAARLAPLAYTTIVFSALLGWAVFGELPTEWTVAGALFIFASGWLAAREQAPLTGKGRA